MKSGSYNSESDSAVEQNTINVLKLIGASLSKPHTSMTVLRTHVYILPYRFFYVGCYFSLFSWFTRVSRSFPQTAYIHRLKLGPGMFCYDSFFLLAPRWLCLDPRDFLPQAVLHVITEEVNREGRSMTNRKRGQYLSFNTVEPEVGSWQP